MRPGIAAVLIASGTLGGAGAMSTPAAAGARSVGDPAAAHVEAAEEHYRQGEYEAALEQYRQALLEAPERPELRYNEGSALYKLGEYGPSREAFQETAEAEDDRVASMSLYNAGNALYQLQDFAGAADAYTRALGRDPEDLDARANLELALRRLQEQQTQQGGGQGEDSRDPEEGGDRQPGEEQVEPEGSDEPEPQDPQVQQEAEEQEGQEGQDEPEQEPPPETAQGQEEKAGEGMTREEAEQLMEALADGDREAQRRRFRVLTPGSQEKDW